ncbi:hypothetical protein HYQ46_007564 [Verticillium longisporum]|nr:hypothetical protein HYQ46_007564 [Verticillium longisporum]
MRVCLAIGGVDVDDVTQQLARGRLTTLSEPVSWDQHVAIRTPHARNEDGVLGHGNVAGRRTGDGSQAAEGLGNMVGLLVLVEVVG